MAKIISFNTKKVFRLEELNDLLPVLIKITRIAKSKTDELLNQLYSLTDVAPGSDLAKSLEAEIDQHIIEWQDKVAKLGGKTKGLWLADFDAGDGYFCWKFPEDQIFFWHKYSEGFNGRVPLGERTRVLEPVPNLEPTL